MTTELFTLLPAMFRQIPNVSEERFTYNNSMRWMGIANVAADDGSDVVIERPWNLIGWSRDLRGGMIESNEIAILLHCEGVGEAWQAIRAPGTNERIFVSK